MAAPITAILPAPRGVQLGDATYLAGELRLSDLATLQAWLESRWEEPLDAIRADLESGTLSRKAEKALLRDAYERAEAGPPVLFEESGSHHLATPEGVCFLIHLGLCRHNPGWKPEQAVAVARALRPGQFAALRAVLFGADRLTEIERLLGFDHGSGGGRPDWPKAVLDLASAYPGWTIDYVASLTLTQFALARSGGKSPSHTLTARPGETMEQAAERIRQTFYGDE